MVLPLKISTKYGIEAIRFNTPEVIPNTDSNGKYTIEAYHKWLGRRFLNRTFSMQEDDPIVDVEEIRELLDEDIKEGGNE